MPTSNPQRKLLLILGVLFLATLACLGGSDAPPVDTVDTSATEAALQATQNALEVQQQQQQQDSPTQPPPPPDDSQGEQPVEQAGDCSYNSNAVSGDLIWSTDFENVDCWSIFALSDSSVDEDEFTTEVRDNSYYYFEVRREFTSVYAMADHIDLPRDAADVQVELDFEYLEGPNEVAFTLICRATDDGWYEFVISSGGRWEIWKVSDRGTTTDTLANGGIDYRQYGLESLKQGNYNFQITCIGDELTLYVNGSEVTNAQVTDSTYRRGTVGFSVFTLFSGWDYIGDPVKVEFDSFLVGSPE